MQAPIVMIPILQMMRHRVLSFIFLPYTRAPQNRQFTVLLRQQTFFFDTLVKSYKPFHHKTVPVKKILHDFRGFMEHSSRACPRTSG